jgi:hypothetical protein
MPGRGGVENEHSTDVQSPPPPPWGAAENKHSTYAVFRQTERQTRASSVSMSVHPEGESCGLGACPISVRVLVLKDPGARRRGVHLPGAAGQHARGGQHRVLPAGARRRRAGSAPIPGERGGGGAQHSCCSPRHRMTLDLRNEASRCVSGVDDVAGNI